MKKVGFLKSIHLKFILIYVLLILLAIQVIGVYFVQQLEEQLVSNFRDSVNERVRLLVYNAEQALEYEGEVEFNTIKNEVHNMLQDFISEDITEIQVIDSNSTVLGTSNPNNQGIVGKRTTEIRVKRALVAGTDSDKVLIDPQTGYRMRVLTMPVYSEGEIKGAVYLMASMEQVYEQMREINRILAAGTGISLGITALLGIFLARTITRPMSEMREHALVMAEGDFSKRVNVYGDDEIGHLAMAFNELTSKLKEAKENTEGERRKLSSVLAHMTDGVIATDKNGNVILMNEPAEDLLNVTRETVIGVSILELLHLDEVEMTVEELYEIEDSLLLDFSIDDHLFILRASFSTVQQGNNPISGLIAIIQDVTEQEKIDQERREFVANVSHELRTPLTTMRSYLEALSDGAWQDENIAPRFLSVTQNETERMIRLVNDLLQLSKIDSRDYRLDLQKTNLTELMNRVIERFEMSKGQNVEFVKRIEANDIFVTVDQDKIIQVLDNIISNALKYSPDGGTVIFDLFVRANNVIVSVADQGMGIPKDELPYIFDRFYRVDKARSRKMGGTGLGLAIAKEIIEIHSGQIWAESEEEEGTKITFVLPTKDRVEGENYE